MDDRSNLNILDSVFCMARNLNVASKYIALQLLSIVIDLSIWSRTSKTASFPAVQDILQNEQWCVFLQGKCSLASENLVVTITPAVRKTLASVGWSSASAERGGWCKGSSHHGHVFTGRPLRTLETYNVGPKGARHQEMWRSLVLS